MKTYNLPITHNVLRSKDDLAKSLIQMLEPTEKCLVLNGSGIFLGNTSSTYSSRVALFEGWSRLMWGVAPLYRGGYLWKGFDAYISGLSVGVDPSSDFYWGDIGDKDQRMVEIAAIAMGLLLIPDIIWKPLPDNIKEKAEKWFLSINNHLMPDNNWRFFRVLVNIAFNHLGLDADMKIVEEDLCFIDSLYVKDGWYRDGVPFDNYNPFAFHFYSLIYSVFMKENDPDRSRIFQERARLFAKQYIPFFLEDGSSIPYGRSLTYRFAVVSFFSACAFAGLEVVPWGVMKGIILRNLRWWFSKPIFDRDGILTIGWTYPDLIMADRYNNPGSPYWALKTYLILALDDNSPFWRAEEEELPVTNRISYLDCPCAIIQHTSDDAVMLSSGQVPAVEINHRSEKYLKFAYSAHFGFSVEIGCYGFEETGCDSMLYLSEDGYLWCCRRDTCDKAGNEKMIRSTWHPMKGVEVITWLVPYGDCHIRVHRIISDKFLEVKEGGFGILHYKNHEMPIHPDIDCHGSFISVGFYWGRTLILDPLGKRTAEMVQPKPNLNIIADTTIVPILSDKINPGVTCLVTVAGASNNPDFNPNIPNIYIDKNVLIIGNENLELI